MVTKLIPMVSTNLPGYCDYGENDAMLFGLLTGGYDNHMTGGRLRKVVSSFKGEVNSTTGNSRGGYGNCVYLGQTPYSRFNQNNATGEYWKNGPYTDSAEFPTGAVGRWGNPIAEIMYESITVLYQEQCDFGFQYSTTFDTAVGISSATWDESLL